MRAPVDTHGPRMRCGLRAHVCARQEWAKLEEERAGKNKGTHYDLELQSASQPQVEVCVPCAVCRVPCAVSGGTCGVPWCLVSHVVLFRS